MSDSPSAQCAQKKETRKKRGGKNKWLRQRTWAKDSTDAQIVLAKDSNMCRNTLLGKAPIKVFSLRNSPSWASWGVGNSKPTI